VTHDLAIRELEHCLVNASPILFLGAGFSRDALTSDKKKAELAADLQVSIITEFLKLDEKSPDYAELLSYTFAQICDYAEMEKSKKSLVEYLTQKFKGLRPTKSHSTLQLYPWKKIYTTNIDDLVEAIYKGAEYKLIVQNDTKQKGLIGPKTIEYIKLHGCVNNSALGYVFSASSYVNSTVERFDYRLNSFAMDMLRESFIFVGTNFDELDIEYYLKLYEQGGYRSQKGKLFFITPHPRKLLEQKANILGAHIIRWTTEQFLEFVNTVSVTQVKVLKQSKLLSINGFSNFSDIKTAYEPEQNYISKLYEGYEPRWEDILSEWDFRSPHSNELIQIANGVFDNDKNSAYCIGIHGRSFAGKSCVLKRLASDLDKAGVEVIYFTGREFNADLLINYVNSSTTKNQFAVLIDNASFYITSIEKILLADYKPNKKLLVVIASRPYYHKKRKYYLVGKGFTECSIEDRLSKTYAEVIVKKLSEKGFEGELKKFKLMSDKTTFLLRRNRDVMSALVDIIKGRGFGVRVENNLSLLDNKKISRDFLLSLAIFEIAEIPYYPKELIPLLYKVSMDFVLSPLDNYTREKNGGISIRNTIFSESVISKFPHEELLENISEILMVIAPQVREKSSFWKSIFEGLAKVEILQKRLRIPVDKIIKFLYGLKDYYGDVSYYWLQLGLAEQLRNHFAQALNHFTQAESINPHAYQIKHALGRNYLREANSLADRAQAEIVFAKGEEILKPLLEKDTLYQFRAFSIHCLLTEKILFAKKFAVTYSNNELKNMMDYVKVMVTKDRNDEMTVGIFNFFFAYLKEIGRTEIITLGDDDRKFFLFRVRDHFRFDINESADIL